MNAASIKDLKTELKTRDHKELVDLCLSLSKFKKDNKELLTYLVFESENEDQYIRGVKQEINELFEDVNTSSFFYAKKTIRKILRLAKKHIQYSKKKDTEVEILLHFCLTIKDSFPEYKRSSVLVNMVDKQIEMIEKAISKLPEDLQYDYTNELELLL